MKRAKVYLFHLTQLARALRDDLLRLLRYVNRLPITVRLKVLLLKLHARTTKRVHNHLYNRFSLYARHWEWRYRRHAHAILGVVFIVVFGVLFTSWYQRTYATSTVSVTGYASVLNSGEKIYFDGSYGSNVTIDNNTRQMAGHAWSQDIGWIEFGSNVQNDQGPVTAAANGTLSGKAKAVNADYIDFSGSGSNVMITSGNFSGYVWSTDLGWIDFSTVAASGYSPDISVPTNASNLAMSRGSGGATIASNGWTNVNPYVSWTAADDGSGSGIQGYCIYVGTDSSGDPVSNKGLLGTSPLDTGGVCQYAVSATSLNLATSGVLASALTTSNSAYYVNIKAIDNATNVFSTSASVHFRYDNTPPSNPSFISAPSQFVSTKNVTLAWPNSGSDGPADSNSGILGLQYRIGNSGTWYGDGHTGAQDSTDTLTNDGSYTTVDPQDYNALTEGNNIVSFRTYDQAGNASIANITTVIKINTASPSAPQNLTPTPSTNTNNSFAFSWLAPASFQGSTSSITYCYTFNATPSANNCTYTAAGVTSLPAGAYATQPGDNTIYVVAKDEAGNINYATAATATFTANTSAPGIPLNVDVADISIKASSNWKLTVSWDTPSDVGAGVASYKIYRSTDNASFSQVASTSGTSYVDTGLSQQRYYYKVKACDSANNCGAFSSTADDIPTGKFTEPAGLVTSPSVSVKTRSATIVWATDRDSDSRIQMGTQSGTYFEAETAKSEQTKNHSIELNNLQAGTTYYYKAKWTDEDGNIGTTSELIFTTLPAPVVKDVEVKRINLNDAAIQFTSSNAAIVKVYYGASDSFGGLETVNTATAESPYTVELSNLNDGTKYFYKINATDADGNEYESGRVDSFTTPARPHITNLQFQPVPGEPTSTQKITWNTNVPATSLIRYQTSGQPEKEVSNSQLTTEHSITIQGLNDDSVYTLTAESRDNQGNLASSDAQTFKTALDTRPPKVDTIKVETTIRGVGAEARGQLIVSWKTDEPATSQIAYAKGASGTTYTSTTAEDGALTTEHTVIVSDLDTSQVYHIQAVSRDKATNTGKGVDRSAIIGQASDSVIDIILGTLEKIFGL